MSIPSTGRRARTRALALLSAGAVAAGVLSGVPTATAAGDHGSSDQERVRLDRPAFDAGRYVVLLKGQAATGKVDAGSDGQFDARRPSVSQYTGQLRAEQDRVARSVGATVQRSFTVASNGFVARLTGRQATKLAARKDVLLVSKDEARSLDTWNTPEHLGLSGSKGAWEQGAGGRSRAGAGTVVGVLDSGIWPEAKSFRGSRLASYPTGKWSLHRRGERVVMVKADGGVFSGACETSKFGAPAEAWNADDCNTKLIGARYYPEAYLDELAAGLTQPETEFLSTRDGDGHGSHTASTAAGSPVDDATVEGVNFGEISGMAPAAKVAAYKVCFDDNDEDTGDCFTSSILDAIDDAVNDGVDVLNFSISGARDTVVDPVEIAFEGAAEAGIFIATSAGNSGPGESTVAHNSPWLTTVAASTHHNFENTVVLGDGTKIRGASISKTALPQTALVSSVDVGAAGAAAEDVRRCFSGGNLDDAEVSGKIVVCQRGGNDRVDKSLAVEEAGGVGMILANVTPGSLDADFHSVPTIHIQNTDSETVFDYLAAAGSSATAAFQLGDTTGGEPTPVPQIGGFSSRGPALANEGDLLKPDISAPGVSVLAAVAPPSGEDRDFDLYSGTSMASPHVAGLASFLMAVHPRWSPMKVKSALMTSARSLVDDAGARSRDALAQGAGEVRPRKTLDPGLFVTSTPTEWRRFLAGQGYDNGYQPLAASALNGPSLAKGKVVGPTSFTRRLTSTMRGTWKVSVDVPGFTVQAPAKVVFTEKGQTKPVNVTFTRDDAALNTYAMGFLTLTGPTRVRMPVALRPVLASAPAEVAGEGVDSSVTVPLTSGINGPIDLEASGLAVSEFFEGTVAVGDYWAECYRVDAGSKVARFDVDAADDDADLDLSVYPANNACSQLTGDIVGESATAAADERITLEDPEAGTYAVFVDGFASPGGDIGFRFDFWDVTAGSGLGGFTVSPDPVNGLVGQATSYDASWSGLTEDERYLGVVEYAGSPDRTYVTVNTQVPPV